MNTPPDLSQSCQACGGCSTGYFCSPHLTREEIIVLWDGGELSHHLEFVGNPLSGASTNGDPSVGFVLDDFALEILRN